MITKLLHDNWQMKIVGQDFMPVTIPGSVYSGLLENGKMEDPFWRDNELAALKLMDNDFVFKTSFDVPEDILSSDEVILCFEGLDTICDVTLNGTLIGHTENMHRTYEFDVLDILKPEGNELTVEISSPTEYIKEMYKIYKAEGSSDAMVGFPNIRKTHCMFGWDWGPRLPDAGIWKPVKLLGINTARIDSVYVTQNHHDGEVDLELDVEIDFATDEDIELNCEAYAVAPNGKKYELNYDSGLISIPDPELWWPNGYGAQPLYTVTVNLKNGDEIVDSWERRIGLRTMTIRREKDEYGESFAHEVNGVCIFAMGADYIPEDNIFQRITPERTYNLLKQAKDANYNAIRVWGGGHYPLDSFWDACDELGLVVWEDMMFACAVYELTPEFHENIKQEIIDNVKRIRHHASLGLWCGNNEMEMFVDQWTWVSSHKQKADYIRMYEYLIPQILQEYDPNTYYWPASPSSGGGFDNPNDDSRGDVHYWMVWHGSLPFTDYRKHNFRYLSEFGFESFPSLKTVESFTLPEDRNVFSYVMEKHQRCNGANGKILNYMSQTYRMPTSFDTTLYASQLLQGEGIKYGVEHLRRIRGICMGTIVWQLNDCWPVASWSSIDYFGRWKALHYYEKRMFAPILLSCEEESVLTQDTNVNAEPYDLKKSIRLNVSNETMSEHTVTVRWQLRKNDSTVKLEGENEVTVPALSAVWLDKVDLHDEADEYNDYVSFQLYENGELVSDGSVIFTFHKHFNYLDPKLTVKVEGDELVVTSEAYAKSVEILNENEDMILSDNYFDMDKGEKRVKIVSGEPKNLRIRSVYDIR